MENFAGEFMFLILTFAVPYAYALYRQKDLPDPTGQYLSMHAIAACIVGAISATVSFLLILLFGSVGYLIATALIASFLKRGVYKVINGDEHPAF